MKAIFSLVIGSNCFFYIRRRMDIGVHTKRVFYCKNCSGKFNCIIFCATVQHIIGQKGEQVAPKTNLVNYFWLAIYSLGQRKRSADWFSCLINMCMNMPSILERMTTGFSQNLRRIPANLFSLYSPVIKLEFKD